LLVAAGRKTKSINKTFYNAATLSRTLQPPHLFCDPFPLAVALKNRLKVCSYNKFFTQLVYNFLIYTLSPIYQHRADQKKGGGGGLGGSGNLLCGTKVKYYYEYVFGRVNWWCRP